MPVMPTPANWPSTKAKPTATSPMDSTDRIFPQRLPDGTHRFTGRITQPTAIRRFPRQPSTMGIKPKAPNSKRTMMGSFGRIGTPHHSRKF